MSETINYPGNIAQYQYSDFYFPSDEYILEIEYIQPRNNRQHSFSYRANETISPRNFSSLWYQYSRLSETYQKLLSLKQKGIMDEKTMIEIMKQKVFLEDNIQQVLGHKGYVVICDKHFFFGDTLDEAIKNAKEAVGDKPFHSETIDFIDYPSPFS